MNIIEKIRRYAEKYDDYDRRDKLTYRERMANEHARHVLDDLIKELEKPEKPIIDENARIDLAGEKEKADVRVIGNGEVPAEAIRTSRSGLAKEVSEVHAGLSEVRSTEESKG